MTANHTENRAHPSAPETEGDADARFDTLARACHDASLRRLSPRAQARLAQAPRPAQRRDLRHRPAWALPTVFAAVAVLAIALQLRPEPAGAPAPQAPAVATTSSDGAAADPAAALDENPDFYLWLASTDDVMPTTPEH
jgi:hypothetical protein